MFQSKKRKAIKILEKQKEKLKHPETLDDTWIVQTSDYFREFLGYQSKLYDYLKDDTFYGQFGSNNFRSSTRFRVKIKEFENTVNLAIEQIENNGLHKKEKSNFLSRLSDDWLIAIFTVILPSLFFAGYYWHELKTDIELKKEPIIKELEMKIDSLKSSIPIVPNDSSTIPKKQPNEINQ